MRNARILLLAVTALASMGATLLPGPAAAQATPAPASVGERAASSADARSQQAPMVRESQDTRALDLRPEIKRSPLLKMPLGKRSATATRDARPAPPVDDAVARCLAMEVRSQRRDCLMHRSD